MDEKVIEEYQNLEEAILRVRELNDVIKNPNGLSIGTYAYCIKIYRNNGKRTYLIVENEGARTHKKVSVTKTEYIEEIIKMRELGIPYQIIADKIGTHPANVHHWYNEAKERL